MKVTVLNGSPKGGQSVTMQYVGYLKNAYPEHEFTVFDIARTIGEIEKNGDEFDRILGAVRGSDGVLWAFPLYVLLTHANYKRFIELIFERNAMDAFAGKYAISLTTSIKFFDNTANDYIQAISEDLGMRFAGFFAAAMDDLTNKDRRAALRVFFDRFRFAAETGEIFPRRFAAIDWKPFTYVPGSLARSVDAAGKKIVVIADELIEGSNLARMIESFRSRFSQEVELIDLSEVDIRGGCLGCLQCGYDNTCFWSEKDGFVDMYDQKLKTADAIIFAGEIHDRYLSSRWKRFFDRSFFNTHQPSLPGTQWGFLVSGPLRQCETLGTVLRAWTEFQMAGLAGIVTDEAGDSASLDAQIESFARRLAWSAARGYITSETFLRVGGMKIFRDEIFGHLRFVFEGDHRYYRKNGFYDFPQKRIGTRMLNRLVFMLMAIPPIRKRFFTKEIIPGMIAGYGRLVKSAHAERVAGG